MTRFLARIRAVLQKLGFLAGGATVPGELVCEYQIGWRMTPPGTEISFTFEGPTGARSSTRTEPATPLEALIYAAVLRLPRPRYYDTGTRAVTTSHLDISTVETNPARIDGRQPVREFDCRWTPGQGGWVVLRFADLTRLLYKFTADQGDRFLALLAALDKAPTFYEPSVQVVRGVSESLPTSQWGGPVV